MAGFATKAVALGAVTSVYLGAGFALLSLRPEPAGGGAPVIEVTLEPMARFDGPDGAAESRAAPAASAEGGGGVDAVAPTPRPTEETRPERLDTSPAASPVQMRPPERALLYAGRDLSPVRAPGPAGVDGAGRAAAPAEADSRAGATSGGGAPTAGARARSDEDLYAAAVLQWIERHKAHPGGGATGLVGVSVTLDRQGRLRRAVLTRPSGSPALDRAALSQLAAMQPFPRPAPGAGWARREFDVLIDYRIR
jgi:protein TonB